MSEAVGVCGVVGVELCLPSGLVGGDGAVVDGSRGVVADAGVSVVVGVSIEESLCPGAGVVDVIEPGWVVDVRFPPNRGGISYKE